VACGLPGLPDYTPRPAAARGIAQGDPIRIYNQRGACQASAEVTDSVPRGTVWMRDGDLGRNTLAAGGHGLPDAATTLLPFTTGQAAYDTWVEVEARPR
jgi:anaerobic selenocysteine-containing dehydrogenase